jgi:hypothetical protein
MAGTARRRVREAAPAGMPFSLESAGGEFDRMEVLLSRTQLTRPWGE